ELALENLALRQQLAVWKARQPRPRLTKMDRIFWVVLSRLWKNWRSSLQVVRPETVVLSLLKTRLAQRTCVVRSDRLFGRLWSDGSGSFFGRSPPRAAPAASWRWRI